MKVYFPSSNAIGDKIATIYTMENCGRQTECHFLVCGSPILKDILDLFQLSYVSYTEDCSESIESINIRGEKSTNEYETQGYIHYVARIKRELQEKFNYNPLKAYSLKFLQQSKNNHITCQFDSRFSKFNGFELFNEEILNILKKVKKEEIIIVGGVESENYLEFMNNTINWKYSFGNLKHCFDLIASSKLFIGADSGMAHLAGAIGLQTYVYFLVTKWYAEGNLNRNDGQNIENIKPNTDEINISIIEFYKTYEKIKFFNRQNKQFFIY